MKRAFDVFCSFIGLVLLAPLFLLIAILIKRDSAGPVFFTQTRVGRNFKPFTLYKFRTMVPGAEGEGLSITAGGDPRVTEIGKFLRKSKLDELPQLLNVLTGAMSLVGPRPEVQKYVDLNKEDYEAILKLRPGITDVATLIYSDEESILRGRDDPEEYYKHVLLPEKIKLAKKYAKDSSLAYDLKLILLTIIKLVYPYKTVLKAINALSPYRKPIVVCLQILLFVFANYLAFAVRFDAQIPTKQFYNFLTFLPLLIVLRTLLLFVFSLDKGLWRYTSVKDLRNITIATTIGTFVLFFVIRYGFGVVSYPRSVYVIDWMVNIFLLGGIRMFRRFHERSDERRSKKRIIVIGAGDAAEMLLREVETSSLHSYEVIGLIDDDPGKKGLKIRNVPVLGTRGDLKAIVFSEEPEEFLIAMPALSPANLQSVIKDLRQFGLPIKTLPGLWDLLSGRGSISSIKVVSPEDVLFRAPTPTLNSDGDGDGDGDGLAGLEKTFTGKKVLVTGAGGSIGSELSRQVAMLRPQSLILFERHEESLFNINMELGRFCDSLVPVIGDVLNKDRVAGVMERHRPDIIIHAAAYKHVPLMEHNPSEAFVTNVLGTQLMARVAGEFGVESFVLVSTDKAVNPVNIMGMTKNIAEKVVAELCDDFKKTRYATVRFGNVLDSSGSVVPLFKDMIQRGGPVTVTDPEVTRYFMTIPEAVHLVLQSASISKGGEVFVLDMGEPIKILDLAKRMIGLYGLRPGVDVSITFTGLRPGEKLHEELFAEGEKMQGTANPKLNMALLSNGSASTGVLNAIDDINVEVLSRDGSDIEDMIARLAGM